MPQKNNSVYDILYLNFTTEFIFGNITEAMLLINEQDDLKAISNLCSVLIQVFIRMCIYVFEATIASHASQRPATPS